MNIVEYKAPGDYLSINDFYKVYGYTCFCQSDTKRVREVERGELTITYVCNHYPGEMLKHLGKNRGIAAVKQEAGIYYLQGGAFKMQLLVTRNKAGGENRGIELIKRIYKLSEKGTALKVIAQECCITEKRVREILE